MITFYGYKNCSTCRKAESVLKKAGMEYQYVDLMETPPDAAALQQFAQQAGRPIAKMFNTSGVQYREQQIKAKLPTLSPLQQWELLASSGKLIKRPIVTDGRRTTVGYGDAQFQNVWCGE